ncbi:MAG: phenylalanine--tRNA ligase subunit beta [Clostridia bacterium]|nr:phenylalanine--tRNA ligase subunit beta [Clostridia bacterium]
MLVPLSWLKEYVDCPDNVSAQDFVDAMIMTGSEVEGFNELGADIQNVVTGQITKIEKHPDSDHLLICEVNVGQETPLQIVTGAPNVFEGAVVPVALDNSCLPGNKVIKKGKLRGVTSEGMLCSGEELNVDPEEFPESAVYGIWILPESTPIGTDIKEIIGNNDIIMDFKTYANRPDCMSVIGIARETAVTFNTDLHLPDVHVKESGDDIKNYITVGVSDYDLCPRYCARVIKNIRLRPSPLWMQKHLSRAGIRPINNVVDITNYVMLEYGQPMHAFDYSCIRGARIQVGLPSGNEKFTTLDGKEYTLSSRPLCINDGEGIIGLAGVMGGLNSEITESTKTVVLECAVFNGAYIRATSRALGIRTEASARYEKGVSYDNAYYALERAAQLFEMLDAGDVVCGYIDINNGSNKEQCFDAGTDQIRSLLGMEIEDREMVTILDKLGFSPVYTGKAIRVTVPYWRLDINGTADIAEEVLRIHGYDDIPSSLMSGIVQGGRTHAQAVKQRIKHLLSDFGLNEINTFSFVSPKWFEACRLDVDADLLLTLLNPLGEEMSVMRTSLIPSMLNTVGLNQSHGNHELSLYEINRVFQKNTGEIAKEYPAKEDNRICIAFTEKDFFYAKGIINTMLGRLNIAEPEYTAGGPEMLHPGRKAVITLENKTIGFIGEVHPDVAEAFDVTGRAIVAELDLDIITSLSTSDIHVKLIPKTPPITLDMAVIVPEDVPVSSMLHAIERSSHSILESASVFDIYRGEHVENGYKSVAFSLVYRSPDRTLTDEEAKKAFAKAVRSLEAQFGAKLRD